MYETISTKEQRRIMRQGKKILSGVLLLSLIGFAGQDAAAKGGDPLTDAENDQLHAVAGDPGKRLALYIKFAEVRLGAADKLRSDPKAAEGRGKKIHDLLQDFTAILDEINDSLGMYQGRRLNSNEFNEFQRQLREVMYAGEEFDVKLKALKSATETDPQMKKEAGDFEFVLQEATDAVKSIIDMAHKGLHIREYRRGVFGPARPTNPR